MVKNPRANGLLECVHQVLGQMLRTAELDMANSVTPDDVDVFSRQHGMGHMLYLLHGT
jgi:hypothetical protein